MKRSILFLALFSGLAFAQRQNRVIDSLKSVLKKGNAQEQLNALIHLSDEYSNSDLRRSKYFSYQALARSKAVNNASFIALSYNSIANIHQYKSELDSALFFHKKALAIRKSIKDSIAIADTYNNIGIVYDTKGQFAEALRYYFKALYIYEKKNDVVKQAMSHTNIGIIYKTQKEYDKALVYYRKANALYSKTSDEFGKTVSAGNLGGLLINFQQYRESLEYSNIARKGYQRLGCNRYLAYPLSNIAIAYDSLGQYVLAEKNYLQAIQLQQKYQNAFDVAENANAYSQCLIKQKRYSQSIVISNKALAFAKKAKARWQEVQAYKNLYKANAQLGNFEQASTYAHLYGVGKDSLFETEKTKAIFELETKYQTEKKEKLLLQKEVETRQKNILLIGVSVLTFLVALIGFLIYRQQKLKNRQQEQEFELKSAISKIETQNKLQKQRLDISRDLHDNIGSQLTFIISSVDNIKYAFDIQNTKLDTKLSSISSFTQSTILELRDTIWAMNSNEITFEDLESRIHNFIEKAKEVKDQINFSFTIEEELKKIKLTSVEGMNIYRTIQEAVNNSIKYANTSQIEIEAKRMDNQIQITIQDNGLGFDESVVEKGNGLQNMQQRIEGIGGTFYLVSTTGTGTRIVLQLYK